MATKTYQAETMIQALKQVQEDMGPEAIVLSVRDVQMGLWRKSGVEVVAITPDVLNKAAEKKEQKTPAAPAPQEGRAPVIRPSADGKGIEFVEEVPDIEWVEPAPAAAPQQPKQAPEKNHEIPGAGWQPKRIRREEVVSVDRAALFRGDASAAPPRETARPQGQVPAEKSRAASQQNSPFPEAMQNVLRQLALQGVDRDYLDALARSAVETVPAAAQQEEAILRAWFSEEMAGELVIASTPAPRAAGSSIVLVGPCGCGKTSTIAKLAFYYSHVQGKKVTWISADTIRTGAIAETRSFTDALGIPLRLVYTIDDLSAGMLSGNDAEICLVDMPGYNPYSESQMVELGAVLTEVPNRSTYLVAPATTKDSDLNQSAAALGLFHLNGLIVTRLDETMTFGSVYNLARSSRLPLAFFTTGKEANGNLLIADPRRLVSALFGKGWVK